MYEPSSVYLVIDDGWYNQRAFYKVKNGFHASSGDICMSGDSYCKPVEICRETLNNYLQ